MMMHAPVMGVCLGTCVLAALSPLRGAARLCAEPYESRSTARVEESRFAAGRDARRERLHAELTAIGVDVDGMLSDASLRGSAALRIYSSFVLPKSEGALANAEQPQRAASIASSIGFMLRERRAARASWLRSHDRAMGEAAARAPATPLTIVLDNLRSAENVGNIFRAAEACRAARVYCCGTTPTPPQPRVLKTAVGAAAYVAHTHEPSTLETVRALRADGVHVWAVETTEDAVSLFDDDAAPLPSPLALVFGNELVGVDVDVMAACERTVSVPMLGVKNSLNVATCASILMWEALRQWGLGRTTDPPVRVE